MHVVGHYDIRMQIIALEPVLSFVYRCDYEVCNIGEPQELRTGGGGVEETVHGHEYFSGS